MGMTVMQVAEQRRLANMLRESDPRDVARQTDLDHRSVMAAAVGRPVRSATAYMLRLWMASRDKDEDD